MISALTLQNLLSWIAQVFVITSIGALLPLLFRIHHPRSVLVYYRLLLMAALVLPLIQPIRHEVVLVRSGQALADAGISATQATPAPNFIAWNGRDIVLSLLATGILIRIGWLAGGLWQLRRLRNSSTLLYPLPQAIQNARALTRADALFAVSPTIKGPVTFGFLDPVILLPRSFLEMPEEAQAGIACHELLHVRRKDWLMTMFDELVASILWFQPAVWWLVARSQLTREQLVDTAVVSLTTSRESYLKTLFSLADAKWEADLGVASLFLRKRHLIHRVQSLLTEVSMSRKRLLSSYCSIAVILALGGVWMLVAFPLNGEAEVRYLPAPESRPAQTPPGYVVNRSPIAYPVEAQQKRIEGTVVIELTFNVRGEIIDSRVLSGPEELRQAGLQTAVQGKYTIDVARTLQVVVDFKLPAPGQRGTLPAGLSVGGARGGARPVVRNGVVGGPVAPPAPPPPGATTRIRLSSRVVMNNLISDVAPVYPPAAQAAKVEDVVELETVIGKDGKVQSVNAVSGHPLLVQAAVDAVMQWVFRPILLNGQPVDTTTMISVGFPYQKQK